MVLVGLLAGCSLPLSHQVHEVGDGVAGSRKGGPLQVIPPGPHADATPTETVLGFLGAQADSNGRHAIARQFLDPAERKLWRDDTDVRVYDPDKLLVREIPGGTATATSVQVALVVTAQVRSDGSYVVLPATPLVETYGLHRVAGQWLLDDVSDGLRLTAADQQRSFAAVPVYYLAPRAEDGPHLVPDQVFLPVDGDLAGTLVSRLLQPPSQSLAGSVRTAVPSGTRLRGPVQQSAAGLVTVDLTGLARRPAGTALEDLSAQLVWTLRALGSGFRSLRLLVDGAPLRPAGVTGDQDSDAWAAYDPEGLGPKPPYYFVSERRLRSSVDLPAGPATVGDVGSAGSVPVDQVAVTPDRGRLALLERSAGGRVTVRLGAARGSSYPVVAAGDDLRSPTWGDGQLGLWLLRGDRSVVRVDGGLHPVPVPGLPPGRVTSLAVSRDGVRVALVVNGRLYVGRVELSAGEPSVVALTEPLPALRSVRQATWASSTELCVLGSLNRPLQVVRVAVDGSATEVLDTVGLMPTAVAASPAGVVVLSGGRLFLSTGGAFRQAQPDRATAPAYPG